MNPHPLAPPLPAAARALGRRVPEALGVVAVDDAAWACFPHRSTGPAPAAVAPPPHQEPA